MNDIIARTTDTTQHPAWCTDHAVWSPGAEEHRHSLLVKAVWHEALNRIDDSDRIWIRHEIGPKVNPLSPWATVNISYNMQAATPSEARLVARMILQAADIVDPAGAADTGELGPSKSTLTTPFG
ncbi:hypothetical protein [Cellulosimicrobium cellulans]|uniref:hypothetical protein n=1 Tax=Cellulosimicrobium cellulans TaxID=1710 RepID=UPI00130E2BE3|nr:hypothetical protein [Cellulosimicrobium cellulans]